MFASDQELHLHLYGCLTAEQVWTLGRERWQNQVIRLDWYADEYFKAIGRKPDYAAYWQSENGFELLKKDYLCSEKMSFPQFQARFNLLISLFPLRPNDVVVLDAVCSAHRQAGLTYAEYRLLLPLQLSDADLRDFLTLYSQTALHFSDAKFKPRLVWTLPREPNAMASQYEKLRHWLKDHAEIAVATVGIDFCMDEEDDSAVAKASFFDRVRKDNLTQHPLGIFFHVGETFARTSLDVAARKVWEAGVAGVDRIGHGVALGIDPSLLLGQKIFQTKISRIEQLRWLIDQPQWYAELGVSEAVLKNELACLFQSQEKHFELVYDDVFVTYVRRLQDLLMADLATRPHLIECCITSNLRLSCMRTYADHPLPRFINNGLNVCVSSDDPGIFATDLANEVEIASALLKK